MKYKALWALIPLITLTGCITRPTSAPQAYTPGLRDTGILLAGTAGGAAIGNAIDPKYTGVGAVGGALLGVLANKGLNDRDRAIYQAGYEAGERRGQLRVRKLQTSSTAGKDGQNPEKTHYEANTVEGVRMVARNAETDGITEPQR